MDAKKYALREAVIEIEKYNARAGWDGPVRLYGLINTAAAMANTPELEHELPARAVLLAKDNAEHLTSVEQEDLPQVDDIENLLATISWPETIAGTAIVLERIMLPADVEAELSPEQVQDPEFLSTHPSRQDVRIVAGALRSGESWCAIRSRTADSDDQVMQGETLVPGLIAGLASTFE